MKRIISLFCSNSKGCPKEHGSFSSEFFFKKFENNAWINVDL